MAGDQPSAVTTLAMQRAALRSAALAGVTIAVHMGAEAGHATHPEIAVGGCNGLFSIPEEQLAAYLQGLAIVACTAVAIAVAFLWYCC